ncbi:MAG: RagB/SusD family nutrient uptake outer membrane protein [Candidatus Cyclobacteriaceae bacterium M3_2C_046]
MKKYLIILFIFLLGSSCEDFLESTDYLNKSDQNFPQTGEDMNQLLTGVYFSLSKVNLGSTYYIGTLASDDQFGSGAANDAVAHGFDRWKVANPNMASDIWRNYYEGIYRTNKLLESMDQVEFSRPEEKSSIEGEAYFLRAFFYSELSKLFGDVPLLTTSVPVNIPRTPAKETYGQIASDLLQAIQLLPSVKYDHNPQRFGHATKWAAEALLARVYLFYTGYYQQDSLPLAEGGSVTRDQVIGYLDDLINNSGHHLINDFRNLWVYTNEGTKEDYTYTQGKVLNWAGENNAESVFEIQYGLINSWGEPRNVIAQAFGVRGQSNINNVFPFGGNWGQGQVNPKMVENWRQESPQDSLRRWGSILDVEHPREGIVTYETGGWNMIEETKLFPKKVALIRVWTDKSADERANWKSFNHNIVYDNLGEGFNNASILNLTLIRYADVLLMHSELTQTADKLNQVRARAGLSPVNYSQENLEEERRHEFAFEGLRFFDLLRWYGKNAGAIIDQNQNGAAILNDKIPAVYQANLTERIAETGGFMQIPESQILLSGGILSQNPGWTDPSSNL